ncbi:Protein LURP-one-related 5 [Hibiscus syriacus]|uniref:Protein LURP-one-related 5 n=1 Tax=Hibiscus syriacus TaxID=106335 RepID=A0A6A3B5L9_HIBSY|nr:Protein LURP-one-related 5 [Hibiscus syriacus]
MKAGLVVDGDYVYEEEKHLTVLKTSLFFANDGFTVYDCKGQLVFRVDSYGPDPRDKAEVVLMDAHGRCLLTVRKKRQGQKPVFSAKRSSIIGLCGMTVEVFNNPGEEYQIEGNFGQRSCTIFDAAKVSVAEIKRKVDASANVVLGKDVFSLSLKPGFDGAFAMGLVLVLDQINGDDYVENDEAEMSPTAED